FVARRQQEDVRGRVQRRQIAAPAEKADAVRDAEIARGSLELAAQFAVAGNQKIDLASAAREGRRRLEKQALLFDGRQTADRRDDTAVGREAERAAPGRACPIVDGAECGGDRKSV